jgi:cytochrome c oxidase subunit III
MASSGTVEHGHQTENPNELWKGGKSPFNVSYGKLMMWYFLLSDAFTFAGFLIAYGALRFSSPAWPLPDFVFRTAPFCGNTMLPLVFVTFMTFVLLFSSYTMVRAVQEGHQENRWAIGKWMVLTIIGGAGFLGCQAWEWTNLIATENMSIYTNPFSRMTEAGTYLTVDETRKAVGESAAKVQEMAEHHGHGLAVSGPFKMEQEYLIHYDAAAAALNQEIGAHNRNFEVSNSRLGYLNRFYKTESGEIKREAFGPRAFGALFFFITGFHGFHVLTGVIFLIIILINVLGGIYVKRKNGYEMVEKVGLYWHFVDLVWVFVFLVFYLL